MHGIYPTDKTAAQLVKTRKKDVPVPLGVDVRSGPGSFTVRTGLTSPTILIRAPYSRSPPTRPRRGVVGRLLLILLLVRYGTPRLSSSGLRGRSSTRSSHRQRALPWRRVLIYLRRSASKVKGGTESPGGIFQGVRASEG